MQGFFPYLVRRLLWAPVILLAVSFIAFTITRLGPGDPVSVAMGQFRDQEVLERVRAEKGLDKPLIEQYGIYLKNLAHGDLGESYVYKNTDIGELIFPKMWVSAQLGLVALIIVFSVGIPLGTFAALKQGERADPLSIGSFLFLQSVPVLIMVPLMQYVFVLKLHWLPTGGWDGIFDKRIIMPALAMSMGGIAGVARITRAMTLNVLGEDYVRTARAKGLREFTVLRRHVARNALLPLVTIIGISLVSLLEGAFFAETLLGIPGIGRFSFDSVHNRDYDAMMALTLIIATGFILANIVVDIAYTLIDPRIRYDSRKSG